MRMSLAIASALALAAGCGDESALIPDDMSIPAADLRRPADLSPPADLTLICGDVPILGPQFDEVTPACRSCTRSRCCAKLTACADDADCVATRACYLGCSGPDDTACTNQCRAANGNNIASDAVTLCRNAGCSNECANYSCVGKVVWPQPANPTVSLTIAVTDSVNGSPVPGADIRICRVEDPACAMPLGGGTSDGDGQLAVTLPTAPGGVGAFFEIRAPGYPVTLAYLARPVDQALDGMTPKVALVDGDAAAQLAGLVKVTQDPAKALVVFTAYQCATFHAPGLVVAGGSGTEFYVGGNKLTTAAATTDRSGAGVIFNVTPGVTTVTSTLEDMRYGVQKVVTRAGAVTVMDVVGTP